jgi:hypothetical protein
MVGRSSLRLEGKRGEESFVFGSEGEVVFEKGFADSCCNAQLYGKAVCIEQSAHTPLCG